MSKNQKKELNEVTFQLWLNSQIFGPKMLMQVYPLPTSYSPSVSILSATDSMSNICNRDQAGQ